MAAHHLTTPVKAEDLQALRIGDSVTITGTIYTARDAAHKRLVAMLDRGEEPPFPLAGAVIYYVGPAPAPPGKAIGSAGPTTSYRMDPYAPALLRRGLRVMIGKGPREASVRDSMRDNGAVYLAAIGGAAVVIAQSITASRVIAFDDLGPEAIRELQVVDFPCIVANDMRGGDIYEQAVKEQRA